mgnify:CR=1 FL=1
MTQGDKTNVIPGITPEEEKIIEKKLEQAGGDTLASSTTPDELYAVLIEQIKTYHPSSDLRLIEKAYRLALQYHGDQKRKSGEPYIVHPLCVAIELAKLKLDKETIISGILHDIVEDTPYTLEQLTADFGPEVALLVDGVTKLTQMSWDQDKIEVQAENLRKMFLAMAKDIRVILIKLADRLHNLRTLQYTKPEKQREKARETMEIYAPIANRLGISKIKTQLDDLSLKYLQPDVYEELSAALAQTEEARDKFIETIIEEISEQMKAAEIECKIYGRVKHLFSIYKKMVNQNKTLDQIYDVFAVRVIVDSVKDCYAVLGLIHEAYKPIPGRFKDYIAMPKANMYQSLHTTLISHDGQPFEVQIRTKEMHRTAELGIAAHWKYKEGNANRTTAGEEEKMSWLRQILEWQQEMSDNREFMSSVKNDFNLFNDNVYCFTPTGDVKNLPAGSTPVDFAYSIHSAVGNRMVGARANGKMVPIDYVIQNGDRMEIITSQNSNGPSRDWLKFVKSSQARNKINQWFKTQFKEDNISRGKDMVDRYCKSKNIVFSDLNKPEFMEKLLKKYGFKEWEAVLAAIGHGGLKEGQVINKLVEEYEKKHKKELTDSEVLAAISENTKEKPSQEVHSKDGIVVKGIHDLSVRFSRCCSPVPGDEIVGFVTRGRGISIHRTDCVNVISLPESDRVRLMDADWEEPADKASALYPAEINIYSQNKMGLLASISKVFTEFNIDILSMNTRVNKQNLATINIGFKIRDKEELRSLIAKLEQIDTIIDIERAKG